MKRLKVWAACLLITIMSVAGPITSQAAVQTPDIAASAGIVINAANGQILYQKDAETSYYPASITKVMTALLVLEHCRMDEVVTFSKTATTNLESGAVTLNLTEGDKLTVQDCMYALMLKSANEVANGLAEHVAGSVPAFAELMNKKAAELGCTHTHFVNPNGLNNSQHFVSAHDMALIARAAFANDVLCKIVSTKSYKVAPTKNNPNGVTVKLANKSMLPEYSTCYRPYVIGGKTGYTSLAGNTLVTVAEQNGIRLVAVVLKSTKYLGQYADTMAMLDYGFAIAGSSAGISSGTQTPGTNATGNTAATGYQTITSGTQQSSANYDTLGPQKQSVNSDVVLVGPGQYVKQ